MNPTLKSKQLTHGGTVALPIVHPVYIRMPKGGLEPFTGLSRAKLYELVTPNERNGGKAPVKSVSLRQEGSEKGLRLVHLQSLLDYLKAHEEGGEE